MSHALSAAGIDVVRSFLAHPVLVAFDFDGTLAPIVDDRDRARIPGRRRSRLRAIARVAPVAVVSGRRREDVEPRVAGLGVRHVIGVHGLDPGTVAGADVAVVDALREVLVPALAGLPGVDVEDKGVALALHYRAAPDRVAARAAIDEALAGVPVAYRAIPGHAVVDVMPPGAAGKGGAVRRLCVLEGVTRVLYVGDDVTDEDVFSLVTGPEVLGVRVGSHSTTAARLHLGAIDEIDLLLDVVRSSVRVGPAGIEPATERL